MNLLIDIGNTNTSLVLEQDNRIKKKYFLKTSRKNIETTSLKRLLGGSISKIESIVIASVVPEFLELLLRSVSQVLPDIKPEVVGIDIKVPIKIRYTKPEEIGQDRLLVSFAAFQILKKPVLIIDFGTAVTFDFVNKKGEYEGGLIFPGVRLSLQSLTDNAALLPHIELSNQKGLLGKSTRASMNKGILIGYAELCDGIISRFKQEFGCDLGIIATGGDALLISKNSKYIEKVEKDLLFYGLSLLS